MTAPDRRLVFLLSVGQRRLQRWVEQQMAAENGLTSAQSGVLFYLGRNDGALIGDVAAALDLVPSAMSGLADRMERAGLLERRPDSADGRAWRVYLTEAGLSARKRAVARTQALNARLMEGFSDKEIDVVARWLTSLQDKFPKDISKDQEGKIR
ncbi:winged helix-turn-helix transcriptional regulator [Bradyrhizobium sp. U87765 SZCCT0131]|uniref:MarR family winged helix-turn-helix transcriptional regulator n=1 Tax=unclassified Bradyrhizobium TaxID=2631580 RepID=UPI001BA6A200|nr:MULTISPECIES: MarR family winged helix-turn-helix transcriptional regulator [unclassified Bradyrhizobium]MBR1222705.1 winged helix-turn-helix transcriptional regulator [Bradyrhizobium sp. U87765 SZCCT0131]MBR1265214.1 winged helix-turn-helix transcriptional regulator [Bradyrhizobium sp. U87765 SZCCT0134]MBR1303007.1 winged helix-turn-helix transcriptional regulator [Bradyrhizobium sp. U87765 SZCCT0110]MBR1323705.1 winged helix-turn-helix transcriptional regulator [Bradyrhizobium sp. U87765 S